MFFPNYNKPGKGVQKRDPNQPRMVTFFEILPRKLWNLCKVNLLYMVTAIPFFLVTMLITGIISSKITDAMFVLTEDPSLETTLALFDLVLRVVLSLIFTVFYGLGPVTAGATYIVRNYGREEHCWLISDFFERVKSNFKQSICMWILDLAAFYVLVVAFMFYMNSGMYILVSFLTIVVLVYTIMHLYIYQIMITFELPLKHIIKNSLIFAFAKMPKNLLLLLITALIHVVIPVAAVLVFQSYIAVFVIVLLEIFILPSLTSFTNNFFIYSDIEQYIKLAQTTDNEE